MQMVRRESNKRRNVFPLRKMRVQHGRRYVMSVTAVYVKQRRVHEPDKHSNNGIPGGDFLHGGHYTTRPRRAASFIALTLSENVQLACVFGRLLNNGYRFLLIVGRFRS